MTLCPSPMLAFAVFGITALVFHLFGFALGFFTGRATGRRGSG